MSAAIGQGLARGYDAYALPDDGPGLNGTSSAFIIMAVRRVCNAFMPEMKPVDVAAIHDGLG